MTDRIGGYLVCQDPPEIAEHTCHLLLNPTLAHDMGLAEKRKVEERYTWEGLARLTESAYREAIDPA